MLAHLLRRIIAGIGLMLVFATPVSAAPYDIHSGINCAAAPGSAVCQTNTTSDPLTGSTGVIHNVTHLIALFAGAVAIIIMVIAGFSYILSNGEPDAVSKAKKTIIFAAIGLIAIIAGQAIINFVISKA